MPQLLNFIPCEKVIISRDDNSLSVIGIMQGFHARSGTPTPTEDEPASVPLHWSVLTAWLRTPDDDGKTYEHKVQLLSPSGKVLLEQTSEFAMVKTYHRYNARIFGFPIAGRGIHTLRLSLRSLTSGEEFAIVAEYPLDISDAPTPRSEDKIELRNTR